MLCSIANRYRIEVLKVLMQDLDLSKDKKGILERVISRHIDYYNSNGRRFNSVIIREMSDYTEYACQMEPILYPLLSNKITRYEEALTLNFAVIFGYPNVVKTLLKFGIKQDPFSMDRPYKLVDTDLYPINFAYYNGDVDITKLLMRCCSKIKYTTQFYGSNGNGRIFVTASMFGKETIYSNCDQNDRMIKKIIATLKIPFPYLCADELSRNKVYYMLQDNNDIKSSIKKGHIPKSDLIRIDVSYLNNDY